MRYADMPPYAPTLMESTRAIGYSIEAAIADIIDNSVAKNGGQIDIDFFPIGHSYIFILDDGHGMTETELIAAMQYGSRSPLDTRDESNFGRYGLGMKATLWLISSFCKKSKNACFTRKIKDFKELK